MNKLLKHYLVDVEYPQVSGAEHLEMLKIRDRLFEIEADLSAQERAALLAADRRLIEQAEVFYIELAQFIDFEQRRQRHHIPVERWWWYLDVLAQLPHATPSQHQQPMTA